MSSNYVGAPTATQAPSARPGSQLLPTVVLPADGDNANAASIAQGFKVLADFVAHGIQPRGFAGDLVPLIQYKNALLQTRFGIDHYGFPGGKLLQWKEDWSDQGLVVHTGAGAGTWAGKWAYSLTGAGNALSVSWPSLAAGCMDGWSMSANLAIASTIANVVGIETGPFCLNRNGHSIIYQTELMVDVTAPLAEVEIFFGLGAETIQGVTGAFNGHGWGFLHQPGDTFWKCWVRAIGAGVATTFTTTVPISSLARRRFRCDYSSAASSDDSVERVWFYIDGLAVTSIPVTLGDGTAYLRPFARTFRSANGVPTTLQAHFGVTDVIANLWTGDVFY
jgi:hypothetical protein